MLFAAYFDYYNFLLLRETACFARGTGQFFYPYVIKPDFAQYHDRCDLYSI
jgi:hypothetical protein